MWTESEVREGIGNWIGNWICYYNEKRPHSKLDDRAPHEAYFNLSLPGYTG